MKTEMVDYFHKDQKLIGYLAYNSDISGKRPAVLVVHDWSGRNGFSCKQAEMLAKLGYVGFAVDMYGDARVGESTEEKMALMEPLASDRVLLRQRIQAAYDTVCSLDMVDTKKIAAIGFCFGGMVVLDLARTGIDMAGVVSFHGLLGKPFDVETQPIKAKTLVLHGYDDPMVKPEDVRHFCDEMTKAGADWQTHMYGNTLHAFTNPAAHDATMGTVYSATAEKRAFMSMIVFLKEIFDINK